MNIELKPLTYEQVLELAHNHSRHSKPIWIEIRKKGNDGWDYSCWVQAIIELGELFFHRFGESTVQENKEDYDITWRCWTWYPDGMEAFYPWKEEKKDA